MYKALYDYKSGVKDYLSFEAGDQFTILKQTHADWILVQNGFGEIGYVPRNYVTKDDSIALSEVLESIDRAIQTIHYQATAAGEHYTHQQRENLMKLTQHRESVVKNYKQTQSTGQNVTAKDGQQTSKDSPKKSSIKRSAPPPPQPSSGHGNSRVKQPSSSRYGSSKGPPQIDVKSKRQEGISTQDVPDIKTTKEPPDGANDLENDWVTVDHEGSYEDQLPSDIEVVTPSKQGSEGRQLPVIESNTESSLSPVKQMDQDKLKSSVSLETSLNANLTSSTPEKSLRSLPTSPSRQLGSPSVINLSSLPLPPNLASELVSEIRKSTGLSYDKSCVAVEAVISHIANRMPQTTSLMDRILGTFQESSNTSEEDLSDDAIRIKDLFIKLTECKDDSQQRSWALHEDQQTILDYLEELLSLLENAKPSICRRALASDGYDCIHNLVQYYQMETRLSLRLAMLKVFGAMCGLEVAIISHLLYSILPLELVSEIRNNFDDYKRLGYVTLVLSMIFSTGEPVPTNLQEHVDEKFIDFLFDFMESPPSIDHEEQCSDLLVNLLLVYNLQFESAVQNTIMDVLMKKGTVKVFTEKLLMLFNRGDDPVKMFDHQMTQKHSVMKFMIDMYSQTGTSNLLYMNDAKVLIDIIIRQLTDLQPGDKIRSQYLTLTKLLTKHSEYFEYQHRLEDLTECLMSITKEESDTKLDKEEALEILQDCSKHLSSGQ